jgi:hypothetical protein
LPYPLWNDECEICFFVKDPEKEWKKLFEQIGITNIKKVSFLSIFSLSLYLSFAHSFSLF